MNRINLHIENLYIYVFFKKNKPFYILSSLWKFNPTMSFDMSHKFVYIFKELNDLKIHQSLFFYKLDLFDQLMDHFLTKQIFSNWIYFICVWRLSFFKISNMYLYFLLYFLCNVYTTMSMIWFFFPDPENIHHVYNTWHLHE